MVTSNYDHKTLCWRPACCCLRWGFMSIGDPNKIQSGDINNISLNLKPLPRFYGVAIQHTLDNSFLKMRWQLWETSAGFPPVAQSLNILGLLKGFLQYNHLRVLQNWLLHVLPQRFRLEMLPCFSDRSLFRLPRGQVWESFGASSSPARRSLEILHLLPHSYWFDSPLCQFIRSGNLAYTNPGVYFFTTTWASFWTKWSQTTGDRIVLVLQCDHEATHQDILAPDCSPSNLRLFGQSRFWTWPYFLV